MRVAAVLDGLARQPDGAFAACAGHFDAPCTDVVQPDSAHTFGAERLTTRSR